MGGHTMREGLTVGRSLSAAEIMRLGGAAVNGSYVQVASHYLPRRVVLLGPGGVAGELSFAYLLCHLHRHSLKECC